MLIFAAFIGAMAWILRPDEHSDLLTEMQELLDETLQETQEFGDDDEDIG